MGSNLTRDQWLDHRKHHIGASEAAAILGADLKRGRLAVYEPKISGFSIDDNEWLKYGRDIEGAIANMYESKTGRFVEDLGATAFQYHPDYSWLAATLDRVTYKDLGSRDGISGPLELKSIDPYGAKINIDQWRDEPLLSQTIQLQIQMACTESSWGSIAALFPGYQLAWVDMERDDKFLEAAYPVLAEFWERVIQKDPPPPDELPGTLDVVKRLYSKESGETVTLDPEIVSLVDDWEIAKSQANRAKNTAKKIETELRSLMAENTFGHLGDGTMLTLKTTQRKEYVAKASEFRTLRRSRIK